jgi:hypothetical protein
MQLYQVTSSAESRSAIFNFAKQEFGGSRMAVVFVDGTQGGKCSTYKGDGTLDYDWCTTTYHFVCEFIDKGRLQLLRLWSLHSLSLTYVI